MKLGKIRKFCNASKTVHILDVTDRNDEIKAQFIGDGKNLWKLPEGRIFGEDDIAFAWDMNPGELLDKYKVLRERTQDEIFFENFTGQREFAAIGTAAIFFRGESWIPLFRKESRETLIFPEKALGAIPEAEDYLRFFLREREFGPKYIAVYAGLKIAAIVPLPDEKFVEGLRAQIEIFRLI